MLHAVIEIGNHHKTGNESFTVFSMAWIKHSSFMEVKVYHILIVPPSGILMRNFSIVWRSLMMHGSKFDSRYAILSSLNSDTRTFSLASLSCRLCELPTKPILSISGPSYDLFV